MDGDYWFDQAAADAAVEFFPKYLTFTEGEWAGKPFYLEEWQANDIIRPVFGWKNPDGTRRYKRVYIWVPRKNGKTELAAGVSLLALIGDGEFGGQVYSIATDQDQAELVFNKASVMIGFSPELSETLRAFKANIWCQDLLAGFRPLSGRPRGKHGLSASAIIGDEIHEWKDNRLYTYVHQSTAARRQPLEFLISTAGERTGYGWQAWDYCLKVQQGIIDDPETLVVIYAADPDEDDWTDPATWAKANPNLGVSVKMDYLERECREAQEDPGKENDFKRYHLNIWTEQAERWLQIDKWDECGFPPPDLMAEYERAKVEALAKEEQGRAIQVIRKPDNPRWQDFEEMLAGRPCVSGIDLSSVKDLTAILHVFPPENLSDLWYCVPRFFIPEDRIEMRVKRDGVTYDKWERIGALFTTPGPAIDYDYVKDQFYRDAELFHVQKVGIDPYNAYQISNDLVKMGFDVEIYRQTFANMNAPAKELERLHLTKGLDHGGHPVLRWCASNVAVEKNGNGDIKPSKDKSHEKIDGIVALINGIGVALEPVEDDESVYEERGIETVELEVI